MPYEFKHTRRVQFAETDMAGIVHFAQLFRYMEEAEHAFYRSMGFSVHTTTADGCMGWPRVQAECRFQRPLRFEDEVEIHLIVRQKRSKSIEYGFVFRKVNEPPPQDVARGSMTVVCASRPHDRSNLQAIDIPAAIAAQIEEAPGDLLSLADPDS